MAPTFQPGEAVRVRDDYPPGHIRTPVYVRGKRGVVTRTFGTFENPELVAYELDGPRQELCQVRFRQADIWPDYDGGMDDTVDVDIYDHWLERA